MTRLILLLLCGISLCQAVPNVGVRSITDNLTGISGQAATSTPPTSGPQKLQSAYFGQPFATWTPYGSFASDTVNAVRTTLYPDTSLPRAQIETSGKPFRYKFLLFDLDDSDITQDFDNIDQWFSRMEREAIDEQLTIVENALAVSPLDTGLRNLFLDIHFDLLVAEIQSVKKQLVALGKKRLALDTTGPFIIDEEITGYQSIKDQLGDALEKYGLALTESMDGIDPSDFDADASSNLPFGLYIFVKQQARRNNTPSMFVGTNGGEQFVVGADDPLPEDPNNPEDLILTAGYKDYSNWLEVLTQYLLHTNELARLRGLRQGPGDLAEARRSISEIQGDIADDYAFVNSLFGDITFLPGDASGVRGARTGVETGIADAGNVRAFLNGTGNLLGLEEDFLLIVPSQKGLFDSYDILHEQILGSGPLQVALDELNGTETVPGARQEDEAYRASLDKVVESLTEVEQTFGNRYQAITGFLPPSDPSYVEGDPLFAGVPRTGSELDKVNQTIEALQTRLGFFDENFAALDQELKQANGAVQSASAIAKKITEATATYDAKQNKAWDDLHVLRSLSAGAQAGAEATYAGAVTQDLEVGSMLVIAGAGALNTGIQAGVAYDISQKEENLDRAATAWTAQLELAGLPLAEAQAKLELARSRREVYSLKIEQEGDSLTLAQALADKAGLLRELARIEQNQEVNQATIRGAYFANPIHLIRAENAILEADAAFRNAQRWLFYTLRALEHKWTASFSILFNGKTYDSGTIFKLRNANELNDFRLAMNQFDLNRITEGEDTETTTISFRDHLLAPNPRDVNRRFFPNPPAGQEDDGLRVDLETGETVSKEILFKRMLQRHLDPSGNLMIPFDTTLLEHLGTRFFTGPNYTTNTPGYYRNKIEWIAVNVVASDGSADADLSGRPGSLVYAGETFFRTRVPPLVDRSSSDKVTLLDKPGEFITSTFRRPKTFNFDNVFTMESAAQTAVQFAYNQNPLKDNVDIKEALEDPNLGFRSTAFKEYSVAATQWTLILNQGQFNVDNIEDIELRIVHRATERTKPIE